MQDERKLLAATTMVNTSPRAKISDEMEEEIDEDEEDEEYQCSTLLLKTTGRMMKATASPRVYRPLQCKYACQGAGQEGSREKGSSQKAAAKKAAKKAPAQKGS